MKCLFESVAHLMSAEMRHDVSMVLEEYEEALLNKVVVDEQGREHKLPNTLFSGDPLTQFHNSVMNALIVFAALVSLGIDPWVAFVSLKGDDCNSKHPTVKDALAFVEAKRSFGEKINAGK
eukprot:632245-Amphidinium_carterae.1